MKRFAVTALVVLCSAQCTFASPIVVTSGDPTNAIGVTGLEVDGALYDVSFVREPFEDLFGDVADPDPIPTFWMDQAGATMAAEALNVALNDSGILTIVQGVSAAYFIPYDPSFPPSPVLTIRSFEGTPFNIPGWGNVGPFNVNTNALGPYVLFSTVPEPSGMALGGTALVAGVLLWASRRR